LCGVRLEAFLALHQVLSCFDFPTIGVIAQFIVDGSLAIAN
jgi:hypothetical protein